MTVKGGTSHACAACKYQRRKCAADCPLAPYFPPDQPEMFQHAHKLFGVSNILKIIKHMNPRDKMEAMKSILLESNIRAMYPVGGCYTYICELHYALQQARMELQFVNSQLAVYRQQNHHLSSSPPPLGLQHSPSSQLQLGSNTNNSAAATAGTTSPSPNDNNTLALFQHQTHQAFDSTAAAATSAPPTSISLAPHNSFSDANNVAFDTATPDYYIEPKDNIHNYIDPKDNIHSYIDPKENIHSYIDGKDTIVNPLWMQHAYNDSNSNINMNNTMAVQSQMFVEQAVPYQQQAEETTQDYDEMPAFFDTIDDRQSYMDSKEAYESSSESSLKDTTQSIEHVEHVTENELKSAAACFSLTSVN